MNKQSAEIALTLSERDARFAVEHLRFLANRETATAVDHAAANLSARWLADQIEQRLTSPERGRSTSSEL